MFSHPAGKTEQKDRKITTTTTNNNNHNLVEIILHSKQNKRIIHIYLGSKQSTAALS